LHSSWPALHAQLLRSTSTLVFQRRFRAMCRDEPILEGFPDPAALLDALHGPGGDPMARNDILTALVAQAQTGTEAAVPILLLALWPGLDAVHRRLARHFRGEPDILASEITARLVAGIRALVLTRVNWIAATLIRNCRRDIIRSLRQQSVDAGLIAPLPEEDPPAGRAISVLGLPEGLDPDQAVVRLVDLLEPAIGADARLVVAIAVLGERQQPAAEALGLGADAGRKRYQRALKRLRLLFEEIA
jgi:DNA-directed RNA polymerase specialized sigma24 family protein